MHAFLSNLANRETDRQTNAGKNIYLLLFVGGKKVILLSSTLGDVLVSNHLFVMTHQKWLKLTFRRCAGVSCTFYWALIAENWFAWLLDWTRSTLQVFRTHTHRRRPILAVWTSILQYLEQTLVSLAGDWCVSTRRALLSSVGRLS